MYIKLAFTYGFQCTGFRNFTPLFISAFPNLFQPWIKSLTFCGPPPIDRNSTYFEILWTPKGPMDHRLRTTSLSY